MIPEKLRELPQELVEIYRETFDQDQPGASQ